MPTPVVGLSEPVAQVVTGGADGAITCTIDLDGIGRCWGGGSTSQLGNGASYAGALTPIYGGMKLTSLPLSADASCAIVIDGTVWCAGDGTSGELGTGALTSSNVPAQVIGLTALREGYRRCGVACVRVGVGDERTSTLFTPDITARRDTRTRGHCCTRW